MNRKQIRWFIATDNQGLLRDKEGKIEYFLKRMIYKLMGLIQ